MRQRFIAIIIIAISLLGTTTASAKAEDPPTPNAARLEFRVLADVKHHAGAAKEAMAPDTLKHPLAGYRWVQQSVTTE